MVYFIFSHTFIIFAEKHRLVFIVQLQKIFLYSNNTFNEKISSKTSGTFVTLMGAPSLLTVLYGISSVCLDNE